MRRFAVLTIAGITFAAIFYAGFAVFAPVSVDAPQVAQEATAPAERGRAAGRLASMSFSVVAASAVPVQGPITLDPAAIDSLFALSLTAEELATGPSSTTTEPSTTTSSSSSTTSTTRPTTTTRPPTTTTTATTTTTVPPTTTTSSTTTSSTSTTTTTVAPTTTTTSTTTTTTTPPSGGPLTESEMRELAGRFFPAEEVDKAVLVAWCESAYDPNAYNPYGPYGGLYQHAEQYWPPRATAAGYPGASIFDAEANTAASHWLWLINGWQPWPYCSAWADGQLAG